MKCCECGEDLSCGEAVVCDEVKYRLMRRPYYKFYHPECWSAHRAAQCTDATKQAWKVYEKARADHRTQLEQAAGMVC